jgi:hypothetical protein
MVIMAALLTIETQWPNPGREDLGGEGESVRALNEMPPFELEEWIKVVGVASYHSSNRRSSNPGWQGVLEGKVGARGC